MRRILAVAIVVLFTSFHSISAADMPPRKALALTLPELRLDNTSLSDAIDFLRDVSGTNLHVNWKAIEETGITKETTVNLRLRNVQFRKVLGLILSEASHGNTLTYYVDGNVIEVTTRDLADKDLITKVYHVEDLLVDVPDFDQQVPQFSVQQTRTGRGGGGGGGQLFQNLGQQQNQQTNTKALLAQQLVDLITTTVQPQVWSNAGGPAAIRFFNGSLIITAPRSVHEAIGGPTD